MKTLIYLLQVSACTGIFYTFYFLFLRRLTFFTLNRWYLLTTLLLSFIIPTLTFEVETKNDVPTWQPVIYMQHIQEFKVQPALTSPKVVTEQHFNWMQLGTIVYLLIAVAFIVRLLIVFISFSKKLRNKLLMRVDGVRIFQGDKAIGNSSFLNVIFIDDQELSVDELEQVIIHELLHISLLHSLDRIVAWLAQIVLWFNPFVYAYMRSIEENHEFEVDRMAGENDRNVYASLLLKLSLSGQSYLFQGFSRAPLKKRISMLFNQPSPNMKKIIYVLVLPVVLLTSMAFSTLKTKENVSDVFLIKASAANNNVFLPGDTTPIYRQKVKRTIAEINSKDAWMAYSKTDEYKQKNVAINALFSDIQQYTVISKMDTLIKGGGRYKGFIVVANNQEYILDTRFGEDKRLDKLLAVGDKFTMKLHGAGFGIHTPISISAAYIKKDGVNVFQIAEASPIPKYPFLYEANKVRFADGQITHIQTYANGKWKSADLEVVNGYKFHLKFKPNAPAFAGIEESDHVRFRFIHEVKAGAKEYAINDWVSISTDIKDYGIKNPDFFYKFYERF